MNAVRSARSVAAVLRAAGVPVGYRYTQTGYVDRHREPVLVPGCEITRSRRARYGGTEDAGAVLVYPIDPLASDCSAPPAFVAEVVAALEAAGLPVVRHGSLYIEVLDSEEVRV